MTDEKPDLFALGGYIDRKVRTNTQERRPWQGRFRSDKDLSDNFKKWMGASAGSIWRGDIVAPRLRADVLDQKAATAQETFIAGRRFRVLKAGCQLQTYFPKPGEARSWALNPGNVITCLGPSAPFGADAHILITFGGAKGQILAPLVVFAPSIGTHRRPYPEPQYLEAVEA